MPSRCSKKENNELIKKGYSHLFIQDDVMATNRIQEQYNRAIACGRMTVSVLNLNISIV